VLRQFLLTSLHVACAWHVAVLVRRANALDALYLVFEELISLLLSSHLRVRTAWLDSLGVQLFNYGLILHALLGLTTFLGHHVSAELVSVLARPLLRLEINQVTRSKVHIRNVSTGSHVRWGL
jgi:hypothetical protein